jgi:hypothetical protein
MCDHPAGLPAIPVEEFHVIAHRGAQNRGGMVSFLGWQPN